ASPTSSTACWSTRRPARAWTGRTGSSSTSRSSGARWPTRASSWCCAARSPRSSTSPRTSSPGSRAPTGARATSPSTRCAPRSPNEVGGEPGRYGAGVRAFHADSEYRVRRGPHEMLATSTHDTKRSEDVRARLNVLSEMSTPWREAVRRWSRFNRSRRRELEGLPAPSPNDEYHFYQTLFGSWPLEEPDAAGAAAYRERIEAYMIKAAREAKLR